MVLNSFTRISHRLGAGFGALLAVFLTASTLTGMQLQRIDAARDGMEQARNRSAAVADWMTLVSGNLSRAILASRIDQAVTADPALQPVLASLVGPLNQDMAAMAKAAEEAQQRMMVTASADADGVGSSIRQVNADRERFVAMRMTVRDDLAMGEGADRIEKDLVPAAAAMEQSLQRLRTQLQEDGVAHSHRLEQFVEKARMVLLVSSAVALLAGLLLAWSVARSVTRPMKRLVGFASELAEGNLSASTPVAGRDETALVQKALVTMQRQLRGMLTQVRSSIDGIVTTSGEIASGNQDLSARTDLTASNLQRAAASMEHLTRTVSQSADAARQANQLAASASEVAVRGGQVVSQVVITMEEINHSSKKINDIIGVIDGIAFQTNILALNAAVEAARAGEQGRGFAVVAAEVRNLAQRSAEAAKEIKGLIGSSVNKVEAGTRLVADAGQTMSEIVGSVQRVSDIIGEITVASNDQGDGISKVNSAVNELDQMTQQNAALVEQSATAAESLRGQAERLTQVVQVFRLEAAQSEPVHVPVLSVAHATSPPVLSARSRTPAMNTDGRQNARLQSGVATDRSSTRGFLAAVTGAVPGTHGDAETF